MISPEPFKACLELHAPRLCATSCSIFQHILLRLILYLLVIHSLPYSPTFYLHCHKWNLCPARWRITIHRRIKTHTLREHWHSRKELMFIVYQMFAYYCTLCIVLWMRNIPDFINEVWWWYRWGAQWLWKWRPRRAYVIVKYWSRRFWSLTGGPASRPGAPEEVVVNYKGNSTKGMDPCGYCYCTLFAFKFPKSSWFIGTTTAQTPNSNPPQQILQVWPWSIHPGTTAMQAWWWPECSTTQGQCKSERSPPPNCYFWGSEIGSLWQS